MARRGFSIVGVAAAAAIAALSIHPTDAVLYNHSPSIPVGFYVRTERLVALGAVVTVRASAVAPEAARARGFDDEGDRFIKRVAAVSGQCVCGDGETISIDGEIVAHAYRNGAEAPRTWRGCRRLPDGEVLLLGDTADSFDGRYWGPTRVTLIEDVWRRL